MLLILAAAVGSVKNDTRSIDWSVCISPSLLSDEVGETEAKECLILCEQESFESGESVLTLALREGVWLCGILLEIQYSSNLRLLEAERFFGGDCAVISCVDLGDRVRVLLDSSSNIYLDGELIRLRFLSDKEERLRFEISNMAAYTFDGCSLAPLRLAVEGGCCTERQEFPFASVASVALTKDNESLALSFSVSLPKGCFAAGARVFLIDLVAHGIDDFCRVGVVRKSGFFWDSVDLLPGGRYCVIIEALGYCRGGIKKGEAYCCYIVNGVLY